LSSAAPLADGAWAFTPSSMATTWKDPQAFMEAASSLYKQSYDVSHGQGMTMAEAKAQPQGLIVDDARRRTRT
jgi:hypothetical protein